MTSERTPESFFGRSVKARTVGAFSLAERVYPSSCRTPRHTHSRPLICVVLDGSYRETYSGNTRYCTPATLLFHAPGEAHLEEFADSGGRSLIVEIDPAWLERVCDQTAISVNRTAAFTGGPLPSLGMRLYREFLSTDAAAPLVIEGLLLEMTGEIFRAEASPDRRAPLWLVRARELLQENFTTQMSLAEIAGAVNVHPVHLAQSFRRFFHCTIGDYVRKLRIQYACRKMVSTDLPLVEIATLAGFADQSHFSRTFKQIVGLPPSQYRETVTASPQQAPRKTSIS